MSFRNKEPIWFLIGGGRTSVRLLSFYLGRMETNSPSKADPGKYWIKPSMTVVHVASGTIVFVDRIERKRHKTKIDKQTGKPMVRTLGVICRWIDAEGKPQRKRFHTKELGPCQ